MDVIREEEQSLTIRLLRGLSGIRELQVFGINNPDSDAFERKGGVIAFIIKRIMADRVAAEMAMEGGIGVRYGCHCAHTLVKYILHVGPFLENFQKIMVKTIPAIKLPGVARLSLGIENTPEDVDKAIRVIEQISRKDMTSTFLSKREFKIMMTDFQEKISGEVYPQY
jgi:selenocysteine lyase/cysteine desulfurase